MKQTYEQFVYQCTSIDSTKKRMFHAAIELISLCQMSLENILLEHKKKLIT